MKESIRGLAVCGGLMLTLASSAMAQTTLCGDYRGPGRKPDQKFIGTVRTDAELREMLGIVARGLRDHHELVARVHLGAMNQFRTTMTSKSRRSGVLRPNEVFVNTMGKALKSAVVSKAKYPGSQALVMFKYHEALEKATATARSNVAERDVADLVKDMTEEYTARASVLPEDRLVEAFLDAMEAEAGPYEGRVTEAHQIWAGELCAGHLLLQQEQAEQFPPDPKNEHRADVVPVMRELEVDLYEAWLNARFDEWTKWRDRKDEGVVNPTVFDNSVPPSVELRFEVSEEKGLEQIAGTVNDPAKDIGNRMAERLDEIALPWNLEAPIRVCLKAPGFPGPRCGVFDPEGELVISPSAKYDLALRFLAKSDEGGWRTDTTCIDPHREPRGICFPRSWHGE